jgi:hypothetical protein
MLGAQIIPARADEAPGPNLLANPGFEPPWSKRYDACKNTVLEEVQVPDGWDPYYICQSPEDAANINRTPEYRMVAARDYSYRVHSGETALRYFNFWALNRSAGVYQVVNNITPGSILRFSVWVQLWTSDVDANPPNSQEKPGNLEARLCIVPNGGQLDFNNPAIVCSAWARPWDTYQQLSVQATATASQVVVALNTRAEFPVKHNDVMADDAELVVIGQAAPATPVTPAKPQAATTTRKATPASTPPAPKPKPISSPRHRTIAQ